MFICVTASLRMRYAKREVYPQTDHELTGCSVSERST